MSVGDWIFQQNNSGTNSAQVYSGGFPAPSVSCGSYARTLNTTGQTGFVYAAFYPSDPVFTGVPSTKAIRIQTLFRFGNQSPTFYSRLSLVAKSNNFSLAPSNRLDAYALWLGDADAIKFVLPSGDVTTLESSIASGTWMNFRMSVYPISPTVDRVICEKETSVGSGVWTSTFPLGSGDFTIDSLLAPSAYIAWGGSRKNGVMSWQNSFSDAPAGAFIDLLSVSLADAPVPIP